MYRMADYNDDERDTVRSAAFGAMALVSKADPGFFAMFKESMAGSQAFANASPELQELLKSGGCRICRRVIRKRSTSRS
jgi:hypothetical protein